MKQLLFPLIAAVLICSACSTMYYNQIATLSSDNVILKDNGSFAYEDGVLTIEYDFWSEYGRFSFVVRNMSDDDIFLNMAESYFVNNGYAQDYFQSRTYVQTGRSFVSASSGLYGYGTVLKGYGASDNYSVASEKEISVEFAEKAVVCIPAHSYKVFEEFSVASDVFRECGFVRDPSKREEAVREFDNNSSPRIIENRLVFNIGGVAIPVINLFYVSQYRNMLSDQMTEPVKIKGCDGYERTVWKNKYSAGNKFYIKYTSSDLWDNANDRGEQTYNEPKKYTDGLYSK